jgi:hypothetical protein
MTWTTSWSDPAAGPSPDPLPSVRRTSGRQALAPAPVRARRQPTASRGRARSRRRRAVRHIILLPFRSLLVSYVRALLRALLPWLLPLALLAALPRILSLLGGH